MAFELRATPVPKPDDFGYWFNFYEDMLLVETDNAKLSIPTTESMHRMGLLPKDYIYLGRLDSVPCFTGEITSPVLDQGKYQLIGLRQLFDLVEDELFWLAARANHLLNWDGKTKYCGRCGAKVLQQDKEHAKLCPSCSLVMYPKISPAIIVAVTKDDKLLLAQNAMRKTNWYSVLAGFVEPGETLEECVAREVKEEVGIDVKNITYFGSQPWPFPDSLMIGFTAEYAGGELILDKNELSDADWFTADAMPQTPGKMSISSRLIEWFVSNHKKQTL